MLEQFVKVKASQIHGKGVFANTDIPAGTSIGQYTGQHTEDDNTYVLWLYEEKSDCYRGINGDSDLKFLNHSLAPNAEFQYDILVATKDIKQGEEITFHYGEEWVDTP